MNQSIDEVTTGAYHLVVQRPDGLGFATTSSDQRLQRNTMTLEPDVDLRPGELVLSEAMLGSKLAIAGQLSSPALSADDLVRGRWSGASIQLLAGDWMLNEEPSTLCEGELGPVGMVVGKLSAEIDILPARLGSPPCIQTSPECRAVLGDHQCRIDMRSRRQRVSVVKVEDDGVDVDTLNNERFVMGRLRWVSGKECGTEQRILRAEGSRLFLQSITSMHISPGDRAVLHEGCDGRRATCSDRFQNIANFRGEPDLPGSQILVRFPGD